MTASPLLARVEAKRSLEDRSGRGACRGRGEGMLRWVEIEDGVVQMWVLREVVVMGS